MKWTNGLQFHSLYHYIGHVLFYFSDHEWKIDEWPYLLFRHPVTRKITKYNILEMTEKPEENYRMWMERMKKDSGNELCGDIRGARHDPFILGEDKENTFVNRHQKKTPKPKLKPKIKLKRKLKR